ncbi:hypothetical protein WN944_024763 [Citrus x changshan-huyou]|uniref:Uncharacterized protein n=1 Tax=Citrus x changshan-huyou TaxID=2935761 RepID=A0AAP0QCW8_9ROSI
MLGTVPNVLVCVQGVNKGLVAKRLLSTMQEREMLPDFVLCIGDDRSDEDMLEVIISSMAGPSIAPGAEVFACTVGRKPSKAKSNGSCIGISSMKKQSPLFLSRVCKFKEVGCDWFLHFAPVLSLLGLTRGN